MHNKMHVFSAYSLICFDQTCSCLTTTIIHV